MPKLRTILFDSMAACLLQERSRSRSVPTLRDLLKPVAQRPEVFYRGYDVYDPKDVGFITTGAEAEGAGTKYNVHDRASGNQGHEYGTQLPAAEKDALIEYIKTL